MSDDPQIRLARLQDLHAFLRLYIEYLTELRTLGSEVQVTERTIEYFGDLFVAYTTERGRGAVALLGDTGDVDFSGFSMAGEVGPQLIDTDFGRIAVGHGTYIRPEYRNRKLSGPLRDCVREELRRWGFETIVGGSHLNNTGGAASLKDSTFRWYQLVGYERL